MFYSSKLTREPYILMWWYVWYYHIFWCAQRNHNNFYDRKLRISIVLKCIVRLFKNAKIHFENTILKIDSNSYLSYTIIYFLSWNLETVEKTDFDVYPCLQYCFAFNFNWNGKMRFLAVIVKLVKESACLKSHSCSMLVTVRKQLPFRRGGVNYG